jgi:hypothetical protein
LFGEKIPADLFYTDHDCDSVELIKHSEALTSTYFTDAEKRWIEFYAYIGLSEDKIAESLNDVRTPVKIRRYIRAHYDKILGLRSKYKNSIQKSPKYPYVVDTRAPYTTTTDGARAKGYLLEFGIDTGMDWEYLGSGLSATSFTEEAKEYLAYLIGTLGGWEDMRVRNELLVYYTLFTPETLFYLDRRVTAKDIEKYAKGDVPAPACPYVFSFEDYQAECFSRSQYTPNPEFYDEGKQVMNMAAVGRACGGRVSPEALALSFSWQGLPAEAVSDLIHSSMDTTKASVEKSVTLVRNAFSQTISNDEYDELLSELPLTPSTNSGGFFTRYPNRPYKPEFYFTGENLKAYKLYTWQTAFQQKPTAGSTAVQDYYVWIQRTYGAQVAARYIALYSPYKGFSGLYKSTNRREGWSAELSPVAPPCPLPIPFEAVYDEKLGLIRYYEHLMVPSGSVYRSEYTGEDGKVAPHKSPHADINLSRNTKEEAPMEEPVESELGNDLAEMVSTQRRGAGESDTPTEESAQEVAHKEQVNEAPATDEQVEEPEPNPEQEEPTESLTEPHSATPNEAIGEYELRPGVIQQVMFTDGNGTHVLKALPGDKKLAIDFALPGIDEHYDHGEASRRAEAAKEAAKRGAFPPLATPPANAPAHKVDGITIGELAVKISSPVSKVIWNILNKNQENLKGSSVSTVSRILNAPPVAMVQALADEHGWAESILSLSALVDTQPAIILSVFSKNFNKEAPFTVLLNLFGVTEQEALHTLTSPKAGFDVRNIPVRRIADALGKTYEAVIVESLNL